MLKNYFRSISSTLVTHSYNPLVFKRFAGHSKWQNIRHIKAAKDAERSSIFTKIGRQMKIAVEEGGSLDPKSNFKLSQVIEQAKRYNMPSATIQSFLKSCQNDKTNGKTHLFDLKGPGGCFILLEVFTSQPHVVKQNLAAIIKKFSFKHAEGNGQHIFDEKGIIVAECPIAETSEEKLLEVVTDHAIESGAEEVSVLENNLVEFTCGKTNLNQVVADLEKMEYKITSASIEFIPHMLQPLKDGELEVCSKLLDKLETLPELTRISDNIA